MPSFAEGDIIEYKYSNPGRIPFRRMILEVDLEDAEYTFVTLHNGRIEKDSINFIDGIYKLDEAAL